MKKRKIKTNSAKSYQQLFEKYAIAKAELKTVKRERLALFVFSLLLICLLSYFAYKLNYTLLSHDSFLPLKIEKIEKQKHVEQIQLPKQGLSLTNASIKTIYVPAVDRDGNGVITIIAVEAAKGSGRTLVDINNLLYWADTQNSIRIARKVAQEVTGINVSNYDLVYYIYANASVVGGPSAGAAITIATIAALLNKTIKPNVSITGSINHDGTIGPVGDIKAKAEAAKQAGMTTFLVPLTQSKEVIYETKKHCEKFGMAEFCTIEQIPKRVDIGEEVGINVVEVQNIREAMDYFFED